MVAESRSGWGRRAARPGAAEAKRRSGPVGESRWWDLTDQRIAEEPLLDAGLLGRGWRPAPMVNNSERLAPFGDDPASIAVQACRQARRPTALDEGRAWRNAKAKALVVVRSELFADERDDVAGAHRVAWHEHGEAALDATWRQRWRERDFEPAWIEARRLHPHQDAAEVDLGHNIDWLRIEDHTTAVGRASRQAPGEGAGGDVTIYEHLTAWVLRRHVTVVIRHPQGMDLDDVVERVAVELNARLAPAARP